MIDPKVAFRNDVYFFSLDIINQQMSDRFSKRRELLESFQCLTPDSLLNKSLAENKERLIMILREYGARNGSGDICNEDDEIYREYAMFQTRFKETNGVKIPKKFRHVIQKKQRKVIKWKEEQCYCQSAKDVFNFFFTSNLYNTLPNLYRLYQLFLTIPVTTAETERSFSKVKLIKTHQRSIFIEFKKAV